MARVGYAAPLSQRIPLTIARVTITPAGVNTSEFLQAAEGLVKLFDLLGSAAFSVVQKDMLGNIAKVRARQLAHPAQCETLEELVKNEAGEKKRTATEGLLWLLRCVPPATILYAPCTLTIDHSGLQFTVVALRRSVQNQSEELVDSFTKAYETTLRPHHGMLVRPLFSVSVPLSRLQRN